MFILLIFPDFVIVLIVDSYKNILIKNVLNKYKLHISD